MSNTVETLLGAGINAEDYVRGPAGAAAFAIGVTSDPKGGGKVRINEGNAKIEIHVDNKFRQAVLNVDEQPRIIKRYVQTTMYQTPEPDISTVRERLIAKFPINLTGKVAWSVTDIERNKNDSSGFRASPTSWSVSGMVTAKIKQRSTMTFLTGFDEHHHFVSALPKRARSVNHAHRILKSKEVTENSRRQGEWFFVPVSDAMRKKLNEIAETNPRRVRERHLEAHSSHSGKQVIRIGGDLYALGYIYDRRTSHHRGLLLNDWHKVVRNTEIVPKTPRGQVVRARQTWD